MKSEVDLAVLMPVHGSQSDVDQTVRKLMGQGIAFDLIIVDDGSPVPICVSEIGLDFHIRIIRISENRGIVEALNRGAMYIVGRYKYIARIDAGDYPAPSRFKLQFEYLERNSQVALCGSYVDLVDQKGALVQQFRPPVESAAIRKAIHYRACFIHPAVMMRTEALRQVGFYRNGFLHAEDYDLFMRLTRSYICFNLPQVLTYYVVSTSSISSTKAMRQTLSIIKTCLFHFDASYWGSYFGIIRRLPNLFLSRKLMTTIKAKAGRLRVES